MERSTAPVLKMVMAEKSVTHSEYDWMNVFLDEEFIGKIRGKLLGKTITIYTITIFPEFQAQGTGRLVIERLQETFDIIVADRVRYTAVGFWKKMGFVARADGCFEYRKKK